MFGIIKNCAFSHQQIAKQKHNERSNTERAEESEQQEFELTKLAN